ncbi:hypothetical protein [Mycobacterium sp. 3519A]|uniref:hypothetical protein n=1 Tax=Mycobacterium sp. 3519A TaxID=2057184 RepID=UPI001F3F50E6|nr:hypothetical protein [Mycobacterium sp. 3519A]
MANVFFVILVVCAVGALAQQYVKYSRSLQRRIYWGCACLGAVAAYFAFYPDSRKGIGIALFFVGVMIAAAYAYTPYIKIGGKVYALTVQDSRPAPDENSAERPGSALTDQDRDPAPDAYSGLLTATKMWWLLILMMIISTGNIYAFASGKGEWWVAAMGLVFIVFLSIAMGFGDASWGYGIARGQRVQFVIAAIVTVGVFAALYLAAYQIGRHSPLRRKRSMEFRAHPRHQKSD